ncbi:MAG: DNA polymerase III subunit delta [Oscillospiraceae bacterium]|nr:DNA polymerase III subunit delta [Oscillospiraceae bacterium]
MPLTSLVGNHALKEQLMPRLSGGTLGHAFILAGPAGSGKEELARILARAMVCDHPGAKPCGSCPACKKALGGIHPDIIAVAPLEEGKAITVDQVRQMRADAYVRPNEAPRKVYIVEQADHMRVEGQNAMLKLLEEGPSYAAFLLLAENQGGLLTTVRSRCETLSLIAQEQELSGPEEEQTALLARTMAELWLAGDEAGLMALCAEYERKKWTRQQFSSLTRYMTEHLRSLLPTGADRRRILQGTQLMDQFRLALAHNVNPAHLAGWLCASCTEE